MSRKKQELDKEYEKILVTAEGTVSDARKVLEEEKKESDTKRDIVLEDISKKVKHTTFKTYYQMIADRLRQRIYAVCDFPIGWSVKVEATDKGVVVELYYLTKIYRIAFTPNGIPKYDLNAIEVYTMRVENTIYQNEKRYNPALSSTTKPVS